MRYIGIDPGAYTAIAVMEDDAIMGVYSIDLNKIKGSDKKILHYCNELHSIIGNVKPDVVYCEEPYMKFPQAGKSMNKKLAIIELVCAVDLIPLTYINPSTVKKCITGGGRAEKVTVANDCMPLVSNPEVIKALIGQAKFDETDSIAIALCGRAKGDK